MEKNLGVVPETITTTNQRWSVSDFCSTKGYNRMSKVRENTNGLKYVTFLQAEEVNNSENIYLGKRFGEDVAVDTQLDPTKLFITEVTNDNGEKRLKLTDKSGVLSAEKEADYVTIG